MRAMVLSVVPQALTAFAAANNTAAEGISTASSADSAAMLNAAAAALGTERLTDCDLYVTLEPCTMCAAGEWRSRSRG